MNKQEKDTLINKIKKGIIKSGFPLEMRISNILSKQGWRYSMNSLYADFETGKYRESDIVAEKTINGISVHLIIECKKSEETQLILYSPRITDTTLFQGIWLKAFPRIDMSEPGGIKATFNLEKTFSDLPMFNKNIPISKGIIFSKGEKIEQDNVSFFSSVNGMLKKGVNVCDDGYLETNFRIVFFYIVVYDGIILQLRNSGEENFILNETVYGKYDFEYHFPMNYKNSGDIEQIIKKMGLKYMIEFMKPEFFEGHILNLEQKIQGIDKLSLKEWGEDWPTYNK